jgi:hypothetical protein
MKKLALAALVSLGFTLPAQAGFFIEPYLGYLTGELEVGSFELDYSGTSYGARLGGSTLGILYGIDYQAGTYKAEGSESDSSWSAYALVGYDFPILFRAWYAHLVEADGDGDYSGSKLGVGFTGLPFLSVNLEMVTQKDDDSGAKLNGYQLSVSLPLP